MKDYIDEIEIDAPVPFNIPLEFEGEPKYGEHEIKILPWISTDGMSNDDVENLIVKCSDIYREELSKYLDCDPDEVFRKEKA